MIVLSHRGLDLERPEKLAENSLAAFRWAAERGFGIELDLQLTRDGRLIVAHDSNIAKWSAGRGKQTWNALTIGDIEKLEPVFGRLCRLQEALDLALEFSRITLAIHVKGTNQNQSFLKALIEALQPAPPLHNRILIFDLKYDGAALLRQALPEVHLAPSVAHAFDIERYNAIAHGTLFSLEEVLGRRASFDWVWLDEWDRLDVNESRKSFYEDVIASCRAKSLKVALISPELHVGELHQDSETVPILQRRWQALIALKPDAICTDYPARLSTLLGRSG